MRSKTNYLVIFNVLQFFFVLPIISSCSPTNQLGSSLQSQEKKREIAIENYVKQQLGKDSLNYESLAFGKLLVTKPESFFPLDSMYRLKSRLLENRTKNYDKLKELDNQIATKRLELESEKNKVVYEQEHVYAVKKDDKVVVYEVMANLRNQIEVNYTSELAKNTLPKELFPTYKLYFFNQAFIIENYYYLSQQEIEFYQLYKGKYADILDPQEQNKFLVHTLQLMQKAKLANTLSVKKLVEKELRDRFKRKFHIINFEVEETESGETVAYYCVIEFYDDQQPQFEEFRYDAYLRQTDF